MQSPALFGLHIPKCAGTTILNRARSFLPYASFYQCTSHYQNFRDGRDEFMKIKDYERLKFIFGHSVHEQMLRFLPQQAIIFSGLRDPEDRLKSKVFYEINEARKRQKQPPSAEEILRWQDNEICRFIIRRFPTLCGTQGSLSDRAFETLRKFNFVYFTENIDAYSALIGEYLGIHKSNKNHNVGEIKEDIDLDLSSIQEDIKLYARAKSELFCEAPSIGIFKPNEFMKKFCASKPDENALRKFLLHEVYAELSSWGVVAPWIEQNLRCIKESEMELEFIKQADKQKS